MRGIRIAIRKRSTRTGRRSLPSVMGCRAAGKLLDAYTLAGPCQARLLPRIGITEGIGQALTLAPPRERYLSLRFNPAETLWTGDAPPGERLQDYVAEEFRDAPHSGETPFGAERCQPWSCASGMARGAGGKAVRDP